MTQEWPGTFELIDPRVIVVDHQYQRPQKDDLIAAIASNLDWAVFGAVICSKRPNNMFYCLDGQQRREGAMRATPPPARVPVIWHPVADSSEEARIFDRINEVRKTLQSLEKYRAKLHAKNEAFVQIERAITTAGYSVGPCAAPRTISAISAIERIYNLTGEAGIARILVAIRDSWENDKDALSTLILRALGEIVAENNGSLERKKLAAALARTTPGRILRRAEELRFDIGGSKASNVRRAFKELAKL